MMCDLLLFRHLLERVGETAVGELFGDLDAALLRQVEQGVREVGGQQVGVGGDRAARRTAPRPSRSSRGSSVQVANSVGALAERRGAGARAAEEQLARRPTRRVPTSSIATSSMTALAGSVAQHDLAAEQLGDHAHLAAALLEAAQVDEAGRDDLAGADARDPPDREEDAALAGDLDDQSDDASGSPCAVDDEHVADLADPVASGVEDGAPGQAGDEDSRGAHV